MSISTLTSIDIAARVRARWFAGLPVNLRERVDHNLALCIPGGCERLARVVKDSTDRALLTVDIVNRVPAAGKINLKDSTFAAILIDTYKLPGAINTTAPSNVVFHHVPHMNALKASAPKDLTCVWYHMLGAQLIFKNPVDGALNTFATPVDLTGSYIPDLGSVDRPMIGELNDQLVDQVYSVVKDLGGVKFLTLDPDKAAEQVVNR